MLQLFILVTICWGALVVGAVVITLYRHAVDRLQRAPFATQAISIGLMCMGVSAALLAFPEAWPMSRTWRSVLFVHLGATGLFVALRGLHLGREALATPDEP